MASLNRFVKAELIYLPTLMLILNLLGFCPFQGFDDIFLKRTGLLPFIDLRPGYPPLGKLPYYFFSVSLSQNMYAFFTFIFNACAMFVFGIAVYLCISKINPKKAFILTFTILMMPTVIYFNLIHSHADSLALTSIALILYFIQNPVLCGVICGIGALVKYYPAILLIPLLIYYKKIKEKIMLLYCFISTLLLLSLPFLLSDPLMYISSVESHLMRGPSESIFSIIDGYYGHTGFLHPTFDATIYAWQFAALYNPSHDDHFRYKWNLPFLPYVSIMLQIFSIVVTSWAARKTGNPKKSIQLISLGLFSYFAFSTFYNPLVHFPQVFFLALATLSWSTNKQILILATFEIINLFHSLVWFSPFFSTVGVLLPLTFTVTFRTILYGLVFLNFAKRGEV